MRGGENEIYCASHAWHDLNQYASCASGYRPMPTEVYEDPGLTGYSDLPNDLKSPEINLLFVTDRQWDTAEVGLWQFK